MAETLRTLDEELVTRTEVDSSGLTGALVPVLIAGLLCTTPIADLGSALAGSFVEDAIVNGVTTKAPSQNAVYAALALKADASVLSSYLTTAAAASTYLTITTAASTYLTISSASGTYLTLAAAIAGYQPLDGDLTSWSSVSRASGFDAFVTSPSGSNFATLLTSALPVSKGGTNATSASIAAFNNITGYSAAGATGATSTNLVFSTSPTLVTPNLGTPSAGVLTNCTGLPNASVVGLGTAALVADNTLVHLAGSETITGPKTFTDVTVLKRAANEQLQLWRDGAAIAFYDVTGATRRGYIQHDTPAMHIRNEVTNGNIQLTTAGTGRVVTSGEFAVASASVGFLLKNTATDYLHTIDKDNTGVSFTCNSGSRSFRFLVGGSQEVEIIGGAKFGNPTGGFKGLGTINATAVYDDNTLLTCYIVEAWKHGQIDLAKWDALAPNREHPAVYEPVDTGERDEDDKPIMAQRLVKEAWTEARQHVPARGFAKVAADRLDIDKFSQFVWENERLPAFPAPDRWADMYSGKMATGDLLQRLWETSEVMAVHSIEARKRELALIARVDALQREIDELKLAA